MMPSKLSPILFKRIHSPRVNEIKENINIEYNIPQINLHGKMNGDINCLSKNLVNFISAELVSKHPDCEYYIQGEFDDYMPSPFSNSNTIQFIIPNILYNLVTSNRDKYIFKIRFFF